MRRFLAALLVAASLGITAAAADPPAPINPTYHSFPGAHVHPATARSAALALADRWLGDDPYDNPSAAGARSLTLTGALQRTSRQDLRRQNRRFDDQSIFIDGAGGAAGWSNGLFGFSVYAHQPVLRVEDNVFSRGIDPLSEPATISSTTTMRELRGGLAVAFGGDRLRLGVAGEWTRRDDSFELTEQSGSPLAGTTTTTFEGGGLGGTVGVRTRFGSDQPGGVRAGAAMRWVPAIDVEGDQIVERVSGTTTAALAAERGAGWEAGGSIEVIVTPAFRTLLALGGHGEQSWDAFGTTRGPGSEWSIGGEYHDGRDPWIARFGYGMEEERGVPEPRARRIALGGAWLIDSTTLDFGVVHRTIERAGQPDSSEDRILFGFVQTF